VDFELSPEHQLLRERFRAFADEVVAPRAAEIDRTGQFPWDVINAAGELGLLGVPIPEEYGGVGADSLAFSCSATKSRSSATSPHSRRGRCSAPSV
jgi:alkylation response protein AidB-like acyl-CoA dehydrogenase